MRTYEHFFTEVLNKLNLEVYPDALQAFYAVSTLEGLQGTPETGPQRYNPLNSVVPSGDSTKYNSVGVQDYKTFENGIAGTVALLQGSPWDGVRAAILNKQPTNLILGAFAAVYQGWDKGITASSFPHNPHLGNKVMTNEGPEPAPHRHHRHIPEGHGHKLITKTVHVKDGETLWDIADREYGDGAEFGKIASANGITKPWTIYPGEVLRIPPA